MIDGSNLGPQEGAILVLSELRQFRREVAISFESLNSQIDDVRDRLGAHNHPMGGKEQDGKPWRWVGVMAAAVSGVVAGIMEGVRMLS